VKSQGVTDYKAKDDKDALDKIKIVDKIGDSDKAGFSRVKPAKPTLDEKNSMVFYQKRNSNTT
jgi:hypothetical protein